MLKKVHLKTDEFKTKLPKKKQHNVLDFFVDGKKKASEADL